MTQLSDILQNLMRMAKRLGDDGVDKKAPGGKVRPAKVGKDNNSWQECKKRKKDKYVYEKFKPKPNNVPKGGKPKAWEACKLSKDKDACFGCGEKGHMTKDCSKVVSASTPSERLKRYQDVMSKDLPNELPPRREVDHKIEVKSETELLQKHHIVLVKKSWRS